jgi:hypothetical protein
MSEEKFAKPLAINEEMAKEVLSKKETYPFVTFHRVLEENHELVRRLEDQQRELNSRYEYIKRCERDKQEYWIENRRLTQENERLKNDLAASKKNRLVRSSKRSEDNET